LQREIHHRVKKNLAVISSLLYLQSKKVTDGVVNEALLESQMRIRSMVMIHERLYKSEDLSGIDYGEYIHELTNTLFRSYRLDSTKVKLELDVGEIRFDTDTAVHCGLIINELVSNAFKHAFPDNRKGVIKIKLHGDDDRKYTLIVSDNGIGLKADFSIEKSETLGVQLIKTLIEQLGGTIEIIRDEGTTFKVQFLLENKNG
jgi:two-component sensor histidine kinase